MLFWSLVLSFLFQIRAASSPQADPTCPGNDTGRVAPQSLLQSASSRARRQLPEEHARSLDRFLALLDGERPSEPVVPEMLLDNSTWLEAALNNPEPDIEEPGGSETQGHAFSGLADTGAASGRRTGVDTPWTQSFRAGYHDAAGNYVGGSEITHLATHDGKLWAACGYWNDVLRNRIPAQVLRLDSPNAAWQVDLDTARQADFRSVQGAQFSYVLRVTVLREVAFTKDAGGGRIQRTPLLLGAGLAFLGLGRTAASVFLRTPGSRNWRNEHLLVGTGRAEPRDVTVFENPDTGMQRVFLLVGDYGVLSGTFDARRGAIVWGSAPEPSMSSTPRVRALGLAQALGMLFFSAGSSVWARNNTDDASWFTVLSLGAASGVVNAEMGGIRGLTALPPGDGASQDSILLCWAPDVRSQGSVLRVTESNYQSGGREETSLRSLFAAYMAGVPGAGHAIQNLGCYNEWYGITDPVTQATAYITGFETLLSGANYSLWWNQYYAGGTYVIRKNSSHYEVHEVNRRYQSGKAVPLAPRTFITSPFQGEEQVLYVGGFDSNWLNVHNTAWIFKGGYSEVFGRSHATTTTTTTPPPPCQICPNSAFKDNAVAGFRRPGAAYTAYTCQEYQNFMNSGRARISCSTAASRASSRCCACMLCPQSSLNTAAPAGSTGSRAFSCGAAEAWVNSETSTMNCSAARRIWGVSCCV